MQSIQWRSTCRLRNLLFNSVYSAQFHSTPVLSAKGRRQWDECKVRIFDTQCPVRHFVEQLVFVSPKSLKLW